jgi:hypothetical protein
MIADMVATVNTYTAVTTIVGTRIYSEPLPQAATLPALSWGQVSSVRVRALNDGPTGKARTRISFSCWATTAKGAHALADALRQSMDGFQGWWRDTFVGSVTLDNEFGLFEGEAGVPNVGIYRVVQDYIISHSEN